MVARCTGSTPAVAATIVTRIYCATDNRRIVAPNAEQQRLPKAPQTERERCAHDGSDGRDADHLHQYQVAHVPRPRTERHADSDLSQPSCDTVREHGIQPNRGQQCGDAGK